MARHAVMSLTLICLIFLNNCFANVTNVEWYRTAQHTGDRLTKQPDLNFGDDFAMDRVITIKR